MVSGMKMWIYAARLYHCAEHQCCTIPVVNSTYHNFGITTTYMRENCLEYIWQVEIILHGMVSTTSIHVSRQLNSDKNTQKNGGMPKHCLHDHTVAKKIHKNRDVKVVKRTLCCLRDTTLIFLNSMYYSKLTKKHNIPFA